MRKILITSAAMTFILIAGCKKELTKEPVGLLTIDQVNNTPSLNTIESAVSSSYELLSNRLNILGEWDWDHGLVFQNDLIMQDIESDDMEKKWTPDGDQSWMDENNNFTFTSSSKAANGLWKYDYEGIKRTNLGISLLQKPDIESLTGITTARKNQLLGEALTIRAYYYFSLVTNFGDVPLILTPVKTFQEAFEVATRKNKAAIYDTLKANLTLAKTLLPNTKYSSTTEKWRVSKGVTIALQAKLALYTEKWADVISLVSELEGLGFYSLNTNYFTAFNPNNEFAENEVIFCYDHQTFAQVGNWLKGNGICAPLGWGFFAPSTDFLAAFEPNDPRKIYTVDAPNQYINKLLGSFDGTNKGNDNAPTNKIYIRYADALLWKAEAYLETGDNANAVIYINKIRTRARTTVTITGGTVPGGSLLDRPASIDKPTIKAWLISERRVELGFESQRMLDLKRWKIAKAVMIAHGKNFLDKHYLYPIPQSEIDASAGTLTQNTGY